MSNYGYQCEWCDGTVNEKLLAREVFPHPRGFVILENARIGVCGKCGRKYYSAALLHRVDDIARKRQNADRVEPVPVARA